MNNEFSISLNVVSCCSHWRTRWFIGKSHHLFAEAKFDRPSSCRRCPCGSRYFHFPFFFPPILPSVNRFRITIPNWICNFIHCKSPPAISIPVCQYFYFLALLALSSAGRRCRSSSDWSPTHHTVPSLEWFESAYHPAPGNNRAAAATVGFNIVKFVRTRDVFFQCNFETELRTYAR